MSPKFHYTIKTILFAIIFVLGFSFSNAQTISTSRTVTGSIKGVVIDSVKQTGLSFVTISIEETGKNIAVKTALSNENGSFEIKDVPYRQCKITFTSVGYNNKTFVLPSFTSSIIYVGKIPLTTSTNRLAEVKVVAQKLLVQADIDKLTYNVAADPESKTISTLEMLRKVPLLTIDADDNVRLNGSDNFKVLINGRTSSLFVNNISDVFKSMPASSIKSIEVITTPPARYDAEGVNGIINIITYRKTINGYNGSVNLGAARPTGFSTGGYVTYKAGKFGLSNNIGINTSKSPTSHNNALRLDKRSLNKLQQQGESNGKNTFGYFSGEVSYELTPLDLLTASYTADAGKGSNDFNQHVILLNSNASTIQEYRNLNNGSNKWWGNDVGIDYQRSFKKNGEQLFTLSYKLNTNNSTNNTAFALQPLVNFKQQQSISDNNEVFKESTLQADYVQPFKNQTIEVGLKSISRASNSSYSYQNLNTAVGRFVLDTSMSNKFNYRQDINAAYVSITLKKDDWGFKAGMRIEDTKVGVDFKSSGTAAAQSYFNFIPNLILSRKLKRTSIVKLSYSKRIERPSLYYLDPFIDISDPRNIYYGNPQLRPASATVFSLSFNAFVKSTSITSTVSHRFTNNAILRFTTLGSDTISRTTFGNIGRDQTTSFSISSNTTLLKNLSININSTTSFVRFTTTISGKPQTNNGFMFNAFMYGSYRFNKSWRASTNLNYNSTTILLQGRKAGYVSNSLSVNKSFLKDKKATAAFSISNPFHNKRHLFTELSNDIFYRLQQSETVIRRFNLSFNYRFGKLQDDIARKKRGIKNDDLKTSDQQGSK